VNPGLLFLLALLGDGLCQSAQEPPRTYAAPQDVFDVAKSAMQKNDLAAVCECITDDSRDLFGGGLLLRLLVARKSLASAGKEEDKLLMKKIDQILSKHGLTDQHLAKFSDAAKSFRGSNLESRLKTTRAVLEPVVHRNAFVAELVGVLHKNNGNGAAGLLKSKSILTEVKIDKDSAIGTVIHNHDSKKSTSVIHFKKIGGSWKIDMTAELNKALGS
jgi:hypothetical protein